MIAHPKGSRRGRDPELGLEAGMGQSQDTCEVPFPMYYTNWLHPKRLENGSHSYDPQTWEVRLHTGLGLSTHRPARNAEQDIQKITDSPPITICQKPQDDP